MSNFLERICPACQATVARVLDTGQLECQICEHVYEARENKKAPVVVTPQGPSQESVTETKNGANPSLPT